MARELLDFWGSIRSGNLAREGSHFLREYRVGRNRQAQPVAERFLADAPAPKSWGPCLIARLRDLMFFCALTSHLTDQLMLGTVDELQLTILKLLRDPPQFRTKRLPMPVDLT